MEAYDITNLLKELKENPHIFICGPKYDDRHLRVYACGGLLCALPTTPHMGIILPDENYLGDSPMLMILRELKGVSNRKKEDFLLNHLDDLLPIVKARFTSKKGGTEERSQQTMISRAHSDFGQHNGTVVCDFESSLPKSMGQPNFDMVTFSMEKPGGGVFTLVEYKCNANACKNEKSGLNKHAADMLNCMNNPTARDWCKKELLRRLGYMCKYNLLKNCPDELKCVSPDLLPENLELRAAFLFTPGTGLESCHDAAELCKKHIPKDDLNKFCYYFAESVDLSRMESWEAFSGNQ